MGRKHNGSGDTPSSPALTGDREETAAPRERDPQERKTLEDALKIAGVIVDKAADGETVDSEVYTLAAGFLVLAGDMAAMLDAAKKATHFCGWCQRANGDCRVGLVMYTLDEVREHTVKCEHNPIVRQLNSARDAAQRLVALVDDLGAFADDTDPRVMATAGPLGAAQADLWGALGLSLDDEHARLQADIESRCAVCGFTLAASVDDGCVRGNCSHRPRPAQLYAPERAAREAVSK